jgi:DNA-binding protein Fis
VLKQSLINATGTVITKDCLPEMSCFNLNQSESCHDDDDEAEESGEQSGDQLPRSDLAAFIDRRLAASSHDLHAETLEMVERYLLMRVLRETSGNQSVAAKMLGITRGSLRNKIRALHLSIGQVVSVEDGAG